MHIYFVIINDEASAVVQPARVSQTVAVRGEDDYWTRSFLDWCSFVCNGTGQSAEERFCD